MFFLLIAAALAAAPAATETPAMRHAGAAPPNYPAACMPAPGAEAKLERVTLAYSVTAEGGTSDVRVRESTNACFDGSAVDSARQWRFEPRRVNGVAVRQDDVETTLTYVVNESAAMEDVDARPVMRVPPRYPESCVRSAGEFERVVLEFDVTAEGKTANARVIESTGNCFHKSALESVAKWQYRPKLVDGVAVPRRGVQTYVTYQLSDGGGDLIRRAVAQKLKAVRAKLLKKNPDYSEILADLDAIEAKFGAEFRSLEMSSFYPLRGAARIEVKNYRGALDDLRIARQLTVEEKSGEAIQRTIGQLEAYIAAEDAALAAKAAGEAAQPPSE